jgi:hypothetical protein
MPSSNFKSPGCLFWLIATLLVWTKCGFQEFSGAPKGLWEINFMTFFQAFLSWVGTGLVAWASTRIILRDDEMCAANDSDFEEDTDSGFGESFGQSFGQSNNSMVGNSGNTMVGNTMAKPETETSNSTQEPDSGFDIDLSGA